MVPSITLRYFPFLCNERHTTSPLAPSSTGKDTSLMSKAPRDLTGASSLKDERMVHYLATWTL